MNRPTSITVISWILIVLNAIGLLSMAFTLNNPMVRELMGKSAIPIPIQFAMAFGSIAINLVSGIGMLQGKNWARYLYVICSAIGFAINLLTSPMRIALIPSLLVFLLIAFFLFRPKPNEFFAGTGASVDTQSN